MSEPRAKRPEGSRPLLWEMWGRETVKDLSLLILAIPVLVCLMYVPVLASGGGRWPTLIALIALFAAIWWLARWGLRRWVSAGSRAQQGEGSPSGG